MSGTLKPLAVTTANRSGPSNDTAATADRPGAGLRGVGWPPPFNSCWRDSYFRSGQKESFRPTVNSRHDFAAKEPSRQRREEVAN
jgi:hypothetical protein